MATWMPTGAEELLEEEEVQEQDQAEEDWPLKTPATQITKV
jgi:hypothetical protein